MARTHSVRPRTKRSSLARYMDDRPAALPASLPLIPPPPKLLPYPFPPPPFPPPLVSVVGDSAPAANSRNAIAGLSAGGRKHPRLHPAIAAMLANTTPPSCIRSPRLREGDAEQAGFNNGDVQRGPMRTAREISHAESGNLCGGWSGGWGGEHGGAIERRVEEAGEEARIGFGGGFFDAENAQKNTAAAAAAAVGDGSGCHALLGEGGGGFRMLWRDLESSALKCPAAEPDN
mmetsp:Transcript_10924/g.21831  ORF Transcript_10924/g.21831 Transcript_10924/m.21831 type:complete len:232 (-) Transcript_10924:37-732(-)